MKTKEQVLDKIRSLEEMATSLMQDSKTEWNLMQVSKLHERIYQLYWVVSDEENGGN
jgi:hypothetical protein